MVMKWNAMLVRTCVKRQVAGRSMAQQITAPQSAYHVAHDDVAGHLGQGRRKNILLLLIPRKALFFGEGRKIYSSLAASKADRMEQRLGGAM